MSPSTFHLLCVRLSLLGLAVAPYFLLGCAQLDEGATQVRFAPHAKEPFELAVPERLWGTMESSAVTGGESAATRLFKATGAEVAGAESGPGGTSPKANTVSVRLLTVFVNEVLEGSNRCSTAKDKQGEIALIVNVEDLGKGSSTGFVRASDNVGRVVFFSDDVRPGQFLNVSNEPIYGPIAYSGAAMRIELLMLELDEQEEEAAKSIFSALAGIGATAYPPASPVLGVLNAITSSLVAVRSDDVQMRYRMTMVPTVEGGGPGLGRFGFSTGYYVLVREEERGRSPDWDSLRLDRRTGMLLRDLGDNRFTEFRDSTYVVIQVDTGEPGDRQNTEQTLAELYKAHRETPTLLSSDDIRSKIADLFKKNQK